MPYSGAQASSRRRSLLSSEDNTNHLEKDSENKKVKTQRELARLLLLLLLHIVSPLTRFVFFSTLSLSLCLCVFGFRGVGNSGLQ